MSTGIKDVTLCMTQMNFLVCSNVSSVFFVVFHDSITHLVTNTVQSRKYEVTETLCLLGCHFQFSVESYQ